MYPGILDHEGNRHLEERGKQGFWWQERNRVGNQRCDAEMDSSTVNLRHEISATEIHDGNPRWISGSEFWRTDSRDQIPGERIPGNGENGFSDTMCNKSSHITWCIFEVIRWICRKLRDLQHTDQRSHPQRTTLWSRSPVGKDREVFEHPRGRRVGLFAISSILSYCTSSFWKGFVLAELDWEEEGGLWREA